jgi:uncharacterized protein
MIPRPSLLNHVRTLFTTNPVVVLLGPRQCGKSTLARQFSAGISHEFFDLEDPRDLARLTAPMFALEGLEGVVILDEIQRKPELWEILRVLADRPDANAKFLLLGSASPQMVQGVSETLAGRAALVEMSGFDLQEVGGSEYRRLWFRGGFPRSYLAPNEETSLQWRLDFIRTFLERDIPQLGISIPAERLRRFWTMLAHYHGQIFNAAELARSLGLSETTIRHYVDLLSGAYVIRRLLPWHENLKKRQVKSPKIYIRDSGLLHALLGLETPQDVMAHPKLGASWEGFVIEQALALTAARDAYFWSVHGGAELDLMLLRRGKRWGLECKFTDQPAMTRSLASAKNDLGVERLFVVYPGEKSFPLERGVEALALQDLAGLQNEF